MAHQFEDRPVIAELSHDGGHALISMGLALALVWGGVSDGWATFWAAGVLPVLLETRDALGLGGIDPRQWRLHLPRPGWDNLRDLVTYAAPLTALYLLTHEQWLAGIVVLIGAVGFMAGYYRREGLWGARWGGGAAR